MVTTRRNQPASQPTPRRAQSSQLQSDQELPPEPTVKTPRTSRRKTTSQTPAVATKRRLRSSKDGVSPLRALPAPAKGKRKKTPVLATKAPVTIESDSEAHADSSDADGRIQANRDASKDKVESVAAESDRPTAAEKSETLANKPTRPQHTEDEGDDSETDAGEGIFFSMRDHETATPPLVVAPEPSIDEAPEILQGSERAIELLKKIEDSARPGLARRRGEVLQKSSDAVGQSAVQEQPPEPRGFFGRVLSVLKSPFSPRIMPAQLPAFAPTPASATRSDRPAPVQPPAELTLTLTPTPTPVGERSKRSKTVQNKNHRHAVVKAIVKAVRDPEEQRKAKEWAQSVLEKIPDGSSSLGEKRKRIESGVRMGDLKHIPGQKPWVSTGYGMDDDIFDLSDSDDAPAWAVLRDMELDMEKSERPAKKRKSTHNIERNTDDIISLNDTAITLPSDSTSTIFNSGGKSASLHDLRPRSSRIGSPMFDTSPERPDHEGHDVSVRNESAPSPDQQATTHSIPFLGAEVENRVVFERELRRSGHVPGSNAWCVPEHSSDEESDEDTAQDADNSTLWTQQPPPAPTPAHASLPPPAAESPTAPAVALDPIELQRARIAKHTPAKPSRLREVQVPSPSLRSDAGIEPMTSSIFAASVPAPDRPTDTYKMTPIPDAEPLDLPQDVRAVVDQYFQSNEGHDYLATVSLWDDPVEYDFSDVDES